ncbi:guanylate kinase [Arenicella chitinivorans]|uniref:Guanylate kinase n=1 Tax=Arenicella chitinivorans TaxID=1329800 RepID=A0A918RP10_9GAMM|nr:guanylate kinase [Arenicella chitinivorans]GHA03671.1 guanylate kinase [Arenicella chitinivorans]
MTGKLFIISAPSGAGKTSLARALIANTGNARMSVSHTTRLRRASETDGVDYYFVTQSEFLSMADDGVFLEYAEVYGNYYGTSRHAVQTMLDEQTHVLLDIDWQGARLVRAQMPEAVSISILPPSVEELERRLRSRGSDSEDVIQSRMRQALDEMQHCREADFIVMNDDFNQALNDLTLILAGESDRIRPLTVDLDQLLADSAS